MKENLIHFTRNEKNVVAANQRATIGFIIWFIITMVFSDSITGKDPNLLDIIIVLLLDSVFCIAFLFIGTINTFVHKSPSTIRNNKTTHILLSSRTMIEVGIFLITILVLNFVICVCLPPPITINIFSFMIGAIILIILSSFISYRVSMHFEMKLKQQKNA